jgi:LemA protein
VGPGSRAAQKQEAAGQLEGALSRLLLVAERYPDLKANQNFMALQDELAGTENRISVERRRYNEAVQAYNTAIRKLPDSLWASIFGFQVRKPFEAVAGAAQAPQVQF